MNALAVADRGIQTIKTQLFKCLVKGNKKDWKSEVNKAEEAYNETSHGALLGSTPNNVDNSESSKVLQFNIMKQHAENFEHNPQIGEQRTEKLKEAGGFRAMLPRETW